ncbi:hypothetical protein KCG44_10255 [Pacificimonas sp. WHA3]|uniref:Histone protein n=1 Tax=Pacificimonas pallii TaxID=2827236 RepID=A0ABS6SGK1_9SPHN|nr:hypothetical protein [Pacificimonas pallii]MBV7257163.1 hypothetical protein [Pacificimonas pallii]
MSKSEDKAARRLEKAQRKLEKAKRKLAEAESRRTAKATQTEADAAAETAASEIEAEAARMEAAAARIEAEAEAEAENMDTPLAASGKLVVAEGGASSTFTLSPEIAERLKWAGKGWQKKAEAAMALWLDEASVVIRKDGLDGLSANMKGKAEAVKARARDGKTEEKIENLVKTAMSTVGRDIAQAALGAAFAAFGDPNARRSPGDTDMADDKPEASAEPDVTPAQAAPEKKPVTGARTKPAKPATSSRSRKPARGQAAARRKPKTK